MEKALAAMHQALPVRSEIVLEYGSSQGLVGLFLRLPQSLESLTEPIWRDPQGKRREILRLPTGPAK